MMCPQCNGDDEDCWRCAGEGEICNECSGTLDECDCDEEMETPGLTEYPIGYLAEIVAERDRYRDTLAAVEARVKFLMGFVGVRGSVGGEAIYELSSEHSVGEQIVALRSLIEKAKGEPDA